MRVPGSTPATNVAVVYMFTLTLIVYEKGVRAVNLWTGLLSENKVELK